MRAVDTNVIVRLIMADDALQTKLAEAELESGFFVSHGVLMECEWVLRSFYKLPRDQISAALLQLVDHASVSTSEPEALRWANDRYGRGADLADMIHLIAATAYGAFASVERRLARQAGPRAPVAVIHLQ